MAASKDTVAEVHTLLKKYVPATTRLEMLRELRLISGNASFKATTEALFVKELAEVGNP